MAGVYSAGLNDVYQLGLGDTTNRTTWTVNASVAWAMVASGIVHSLAIKEDGTLWAFGDNSYGQLGQGDDVAKTAIVQVGSSTTWATASAGTASYAIKADGTLWVWGENLAGELGLGDTTQRTSPTQVGTGTNWAYVSGGYYFALAIKTDGTLWAAGLNDLGQLGLGDTTDRTTWTQVGSATTWASVSASYSHTLALRTDGTLWSCGFNDVGQLGQGDTTQRTTITQVGSATDWAFICAGVRVSTSYAVKTGGTLYAWGRNVVYELGLGDTTNRTSPTQVGSATNWAKVRAGGAGYLAITTAGAVYAAGDNTYGQLGFGDTTTRQTPTATSLTSGYDADGGTSFFIVYTALGNSGTLDIPIHFDVTWPNGTLDIPIHFDVSDTGTLDIPIHFAVFGTLQTSLWTAKVTLDGVDVSAALTGAPEVDGEEGAARVASFTLLPAAGVVSPATWTGAAVTIDLVRIVGGVEIPVRQFTGVVDVATFNPSGRSVSFACTDDRQNKVAALTKAEIDTLTPDALYHVGAQGEIDEHWAYAMARMESQPASLDCGPYGNPRVTNWDGLATFYTFTDASVFYNAPYASELPRRTGLVNRVDVAYQYRFYRCRERHAWLGWSKGVTGTDALASGYAYPTQDMVEAALDGTGWHRISTAYSNAPTQVPVVSPSGYYITCSGVSTMTAHLAQRHSQTVTENYTLTVSAPASVAANGELAKPMRGTYATTWNPDQWEDDFTVTTPDASAADVDYGGDQTRAQSDACIETLLAIANTRILASHRQARVTFTIPCMPELDLIHAVEIDTAAIQATGKVVRVVHRVNIATGEASTTVTLALSGIAASGIVTPDVLDAPAAPDVDAALAEDDWVANIGALGTHVGAVTNHAYADSLMGYLVNAPENITITDGTDQTTGANPYYDADWEYPTTGFRVQLPGVADTHRNPLELSQTASYAVEIPADPLTTTVS